MFVYVSYGKGVFFCEVIVKFNWINIGIFVLSVSFWVWEFVCFGINYMK